MNTPDRLVRVVELGAIGLDSPGDHFQAMVLAHIKISKGGINTG
jgi:hypothetical protein